MFSEEERGKRPQLAHMSFGWGPHNCIGMRFALMEVKLTFIEILCHYTLLIGHLTLRYGEKHLVLCDYRHMLLTLATTDTSPDLLWYNGLSKEWNFAECHAKRVTNLHTTQNCIS